MLEDTRSMKEQTRIDSISKAIEQIDKFLYQVDYSKRDLDYTFNKIEVTGNKIASIGCAEGSETHAFKWLIESAKVIGIDKKTNSANIERGKTINAVQYILENRKSLEQSRSVKEWWKKIPKFVKDFDFPEFEEFTFGIKGDQCSLNNESIDLVYCSSVIYQIKNSLGDDGVLITFQEIKRVLEPNGYFVFYDREDFIELLGQVFQWGNIMHEKEGPISNLYVCKNNP